MIVYKLFKMKNTNFLKSKRSIRKFEEDNKVFHIHKVDDNIIHIVFKLNNVENSMQFLNYFYIIDKGYIYAEYDCLKRELLPNTVIFPYISETEADALKISIPYIPILINEFNAHLDNFLSN